MSVKVKVEIDVDVNQDSNTTDERDYSQLESFGVEAHPVTSSEIINQQVLSNKDAETLLSYLPSESGISKIVQIHNAAQGHIYQELSGKWDSEMIKIARQLKMKKVATLESGVFLITDDAVNNANCSFGDDVSGWKITKWEVIADTNKGVFRDTISWESTTYESKIFASTSHEWRIY